jgi:hypothetical protein
VDNYDNEEDVADVNAARLFGRMVWVDPTALGSSD